MRRIVSGIMLILLLISMLTLAFNVQPVNTEHTLFADSNTEDVVDTAGKVYQVVLVTGDIVTVTGLSEEQRDISIIPAESARLGQSFHMFENPDGTYVIPSDVNMDKLDVELFNIDYLISEGYYGMANIPLIVSIKRLADQNLQSIEGDVRSFKGRVRNSFPRLSALAVELPRDTIKDFVRIMLERADTEKIWLDKKAHVSLSESVPLIGGPELWDAGYNGTGIEIAILDTGIDDTHPDLDDLDDDPITSDPKIVRAIDFTDDFTTDDLYGHGTHCAGIAAGTGAMSGGLNKGVAPGAWLWNVKVLDQYGWGFDSWIISGIEYAAYGPDGIEDTGDEADIISMSLGGAPTDGTDPMSLAVDAAVDAGIVVVIAAGNEQEYFQIGSPGAAKKVITVGASDKYDNLAGFSSKGPTIDFRVKPDLLAPGVGINSAVPYNLFGTYYQSKSGTSMATPHVAGAAALIMEACQTPPLDWPLPKYVKNALISTAHDTGYNVYEQGGGRIYVPSAVDTEILVDPATVSFGQYSEDTLDNVTLTFHNLNTTSSRVLTLDTIVYDVNTGTPVDCASLNATTLSINPSSNASVLLTINTAVSSSMYSGEVTVDIDTGETVRAIFGFSRMNEVTVTKVDMSGAPAAYDYVHIIGSPGFPELTDGRLDEYGNATFYVSVGNYHVISTGWDYDLDATIYTVEENVSVTGDTIVHLDERDTFEIDFDMNKPDQVVAEKFSVLLYEEEQHPLLDIGDLWRYPNSTLTYASPTSINAGFAYSYYPEAYYDSYDPNVVNAPEWHKLLFTLEEVTGNATFVADYDVLVRRITDYEVAMTPDVAQRVQFVHDPIAWSSWTFGWRMNAPQSRIEWLSPEPAWYAGWYSKWDPLWGWDFSEPSYSYPLGAETYLALGEHPFTSGVRMYVEAGYLSLYGSISADTFGNEFANFSRNVSGNLTIIQDEVEVYNAEIWDHFGMSLSFSGEPEFNVVVEGSCDLDLSTSTVTEWAFTANMSKDYRPPRITMRPLGSDLLGTVPSGEVLVNVTVSDDSPTYSVELEYSLDDGETWMGTTKVGSFGDTHQFSLGMFSNNSNVSLRANATDSVGNRISQTTIRGFHTSYSTLFVNPASTSVTVEDVFTVNVTLDYVEDLYSFQFFLGFDNAQLNCTGIDYTGYLNEPVYIAAQEVNDTGGYVHFAVTSLAPASGKTGGGALATVHFQCLAPGNSTLHLYNTVLADSLTALIPHQTSDGWVENTGAILSVSPASTSVTVGDTFIVNVTVTDVVDLYCFEFKLDYDTSLLDCTEIAVEDLWYSVFVCKEEIRDDLGMVAVVATGIAPSTGYTGSGTLATITFQCSGPGECVLDLFDTLLFNSFALPVSTPPYLGDANLDGVVNGLDLAIVCMAFGSASGDPGYISDADFNSDGFIDLMDLLTVAVNFGRVYPGEASQPTDNVIVHSVIDGYVIQDFKPCVFVNPVENIFYTDTTPVGTEFNVTIEAADWPEPGVYSFEFKLYFNSSMLEPVVAKTGIDPDCWITDWIAVNGFDTGDVPFVDPVTGETFLWFSASLLGGGGNVGGGIMAKAGFKIIAEPPTGQTLSCDLDLRDVIMIDPSTTPPSAYPEEYYEVQSGTYEYISPEPPTTLSINPASTTVVVGEEFTVNVTLEYATNLYAYEFKLGFDNTQLNCTDLEYAGYLGTPGVDCMIFAQTINNPSGYVELAVSRIQPPPGITGGGVLATVHFQCLAPGNSTLHLYDTYLSDDQPMLIPHMAEDAEVTQMFANLRVDSVVVVDHGCDIYVNDTYYDGAAYYVPVNVTVENVVGVSCSFNVSLTVYWIDGSLVENIVEQRVYGLNPGENVTLTFGWRPQHIGYYNLTAVVDCDGEVAESDENDNTLAISSYEVTIQGDVNSDRIVNIMDAVVVCLAWGATPSDPQWNICADLDHNGLINIMDAVRICLHWGQTWP